MTPTANQAPRRGASRLGWLVALAALAGLAFNCSGSDETLDPAFLGAPDRAGATEAEPCQSGATRTCYITLGEHNGILSCYQGTQTCNDGVWGECTDGHSYETTVAEVRRRAQDRTALRGQALSPATSCDFDPCDPFCQYFDEVPDGGLPAQLDASPDAPGAINTGPTVPYDWVGGSYATLPAGTLEQVFNEPCATGADCQLNTYCRNPDSGSCDHHKCEVGAQLEATCDPCVEEICALDPDCCAPEAPPACSHDPCVAGAALVSDCDPCVTAVCAARPACCTTLWDSTCVNQIASSCAAAPISSHCACGAGEAASGGRCYALNAANVMWQQARNACRARGAGWDLATIGSQAENDLVVSLSPWRVWIGGNDLTVEGQWRWVDVAGGTNNGTLFSGGFTKWAAWQPDNNGFWNADCAVADPAGWYDEPCNWWYNSACEGPPSQLVADAAPPSAGWGQSCVDMVASVCGAVCGEGDPTPTDGICTPWYPDETDPNCAEFDLAVGAGCTDSGASIVTICNHGQTAAPAGIKIVHWPAGAGQFGFEAPDTSSATGAESCVTTEAVPSGWCINVSDCLSDNPDGREIMVNPPDGTENTDECHFFDNWGIFSASEECGTPVCSGNGSAATLRRVNMYFMVDVSASMGWDINGVYSEQATRWGATTSAMKAFFADPGSDGLQVAMNFFPHSTCVPTAGDCDSATCREPLVPLGELVHEHAPTDTQEALLITALDHNPDNPNAYRTPTSTALRGALESQRARQEQRPNEVYVVVLVTDGQPTECDTNVTNISQIAGQYYSDYDIRTYVIGIGGVSEATIEQIATAGGGADQAFFVSATGGGTVADQVVAALQSIAEQAVSCEFELPNQGAFDPELATVQYIASTPLDDPDPICLADQSESGGRCYYPAVDPAQWGAALENCRLLGPGWDLASITDAAEDSLVAGLVQSEIGTKAWTGLNSRASASFTWSSGEALSYTHWATGQPSADDCGVTNTNGTWSSINCTTNRLGVGYVCEGPMTGDTNICGVGEIEGPNGDCFYVDTTARSWAEAQLACQAHAAGWDLARIRSDGDNTLATVAAGGSSVWIGASDSATEGTWLWTDGTPFWQVDPPTCPADSFESSSGTTCLYVDTTARSWTAARSACQALGTGWDLAAVRSAEDNTLIQGQLSSDVWVGGNDRVAEGTWRWPDATQFWSGGVAGGSACAADQVHNPANGRCYAFYTAEQNWQTAQNNCIALGTGWNLADILNSTENTFVRDRIVASTWLGGDDMGFWSEGAWYWPDNTNFWNGEAAPWGSAPWGRYANWSWGQPNNNGDEDCLEMYTSGQWNDSSCLGLRDYVCEGPENSGGTPVGGQYTNFMTDEPDDAEGSGNGDCLMFRAADGQWEDWGCDSTFAAVCEGPKTTNSGPVGAEYANWASGEPNDGGGMSDCGVLSTSGTWLDTDCSSTYPAVCRGPKPPPPDPPAPPVGGLLTNIGSAAACTDASDAHWYYDDQNNPTSLLVCPATCERIKQDRKAKLAIEIGCYPPEEPPPERTTWIAPEVYTEIYEAECGDDTPQWGFLAYDTVTPDGSLVVFEARTAETEAKLLNAEFVILATAQSTPVDTQVCLMSGPSPCPVDAYDALGGGLPAALPFLELQVSVIPGSGEGGSEPLANSWQLTYSCPPGM